MDSNENQSATPRVLLVDDDEALRLVFERMLRGSGFRVEDCQSGAEALDLLRQNAFDVVVLDLHMPKMDGHETLERIRRHHPVLPVVVLTADASVDAVVRAVKLGAYDFIEKPPDRLKLVTVVTNGIERNRMAIRLAELELGQSSQRDFNMVGESRPMLELQRQIVRLAHSDVSVYIRGESGSGKELVAQEIHRRSTREKGPIVAVNCAAIPESLQESQLFGHEKGAFTGAAARHVGTFEQADGGTLFLDEVAELSLPLQAKLLRVIQERKFRRVGGDKDIETDFRLLVATHRQLLDEVEAGRFRADLYYRIVVYELEVPPLRNRPDDVPRLVQFFVDRHSGDNAPAFPVDVIDALMKYRWPGNVRELENAVQRALVSATGDDVALRDLPPRLEAEARSTLEDSSEQAGLDDGGLNAPPRTSELNLAAVERRAIEEVMRRYDGNRSVVAQKLGIGRTTLYRKLREFGLAEDE